MCEDFFDVNLCKHHALNSLLGVIMTGVVRTGLAPGPGIGNPVLAAVITTLIGRSLTIQG